MKNQSIVFENLQSLLGNEHILQAFWQCLLGIQISIDEIEREMPWCNMSSTPDILAQDIYGREYLIFIRSAGNTRFKEKSDGIRAIEKRK